MAKRVLMSPTVDKAVASRGKSKPTATGYATLVQDLYQRAAEMMAELQSGEGTISQRAIALNTIAKSLPLIRAAEEAAASHIRVNDKDIKALSDAELRALANRNSSIPHTERDAGAVAPTRVSEAENELVGKDPTLPSDASDTEF